MKNMQSSKQQTAVDWILEKIGKHHILEPTLLKNVIERAKQMEKEQIIKADLAGVERTVMTFIKYYIQLPGVLNTIKNIKESTDTHENGEQYYNETYGEKS